MLGVGISRILVAAGAIASRTPTGAGTGGRAASRAGRFTGERCSSTWYFVVDASPNTLDRLNNRGVGNDRPDDNCDQSNQQSIFDCSLTLIGKEEACHRCTRFPQ